MLATWVYTDHNPWHSNHHQQQWQEGISLFRLDLSSWLLVSPSFSWLTYNSSVRVYSYSHLGMHVLSTHNECHVHLHSQSTIISLKLHALSYFLIYSLLLWIYNVYPAIDLTNFVSAVEIPISHCFSKAQLSHMHRNVGTTIIHVISIMKP